MALGLTYRGVDVFAPTNESGSPRSPHNQEAQVWSTDMERYISGLASSTSASVVKATRTELNAVVGSFAEGDIGLAVADPIEEYRGVYKKSLGSWIKISELPQDLAETAAASAQLDRTLAQVAASQAVPAAATATTKATEAAASATVAAGYAIAAGISRVFSTKAEANAALASVGANAFVQILVDESEGNVTTIYRKEGGVYVLKVKQGRKDVRPEDFGALGNNVADDGAAFIAAKAWLAANGGNLVLSGQKYYIGETTALNLDGVTIVAEDGAAIRGKLDRKSNIALLNPLTLEYEDGEYTYKPEVLTTKYNRPIEEKEVFINEGDANRSVSVAVDCTNMLQREIPWPGGSWATISSGSINADQVDFTLVSDKVYAATMAVRGGDQFTTVFTPGEYVRVASVRTAMGAYHFALNGMGGDGGLYWVPDGGVATLVTNIDWPGRLDQEPWMPGYAEWTIDPITLEHFCLRLNGMIINGIFRVGAGDFIVEAGFGVRNISGGGLGGIRWTTLTRNAPVAGRGYMKILILGNSRSAKNHGDWPTRLREKMENSLGRGVLRMDNKAVDSTTSSQTLAYCQAHPEIFSGVTHVIIASIDNDAQNNIGEALSKSNHTAIINLAQSVNAEVIVNLYPAPYPEADSGYGAVIFNEVEWPKYRAMIRKLAASKGCKIVDMTQDGKPLQVYEMQDAPNDPDFIGTYRSGYRDGIHWTDAFADRIAQSNAEAIAGIPPARSRALEERLMPTQMFRTSWAAGSIAPRISISNEGGFRVNGIISGGTKTANTPLFYLPESIQPSSSRWFKVMTDDNKEVRCRTSGSNFILVDPMDSSSTGLFLDGISWMTR